MLAAGQSVRFGSTKQLAIVDGKTLIQRAAAVASEVCNGRVVVVAGADWQRVTTSALNASDFFAYNELFRDGIGSSIALATKVCENRADAMLLMLADQPLVTRQHLQALIDAWSGEKTDIVASAYARTVGPPILFGSDAFGQLLRLTGDAGARTLLRDARFNISSVSFEDAATDIDTVADLESLN